MHSHDVPRRRTDICRLLAFVSAHGQCGSAMAVKKSQPRKGLKPAQVKAAAMFPIVGVGAPEGVNTAYLASIVESSPDAMVIVNRSGEIQLVNKETERLFGYTREELVGRAEEMLMPAGCRREHVAERDGYIAAPSNQPMGVGMPLSGRRKDGSEFPVEISLSPLQTESGTLVCSVIRDVSERKKSEEALHESEKGFRGLVTASSDVLYRMSPDWSEMRQLTGGDFLVETKTASRTWLQDYVPKDDHPKLMAAIRKAIRTKGIFEFEHRVLRADGTMAWTFSRAVPLLDEKGRITEWFGTAADVTERKEAEEALRKLNEELEERVAERTAALVVSTQSLLRSTAELKSANEERRQLQDEVLRISEAERARIGEDLHDDLGQQLAGIWCLSLALQKDLEARSSPEATDAARISGYLSQSLALTRSLARGLHPVAPEPGGLMAALTELAERSSKMFKVRCRLVCRHRVDIHDPAMATHLYRIAQEAVTNACKHGHAKHIHIALSTTSKRLKLSISDDGRGVPKPDDAGNGGMGIRLMNFRAESLGGSLVFHWKPGGGSRVTCTVPFSTRSEKRKH